MAITSKAVVVLGFVLFVWASRLQATTFAVIGDFGVSRPPPEDVANLVNSWHPEWIITVGDNNYGRPDQLDDYVGRIYHSYIYPYQGKYGPGADVNRFFPSLGNHDWTAGHVNEHLAYFTLPGNERYYDFVKESVHFFAVDSDEREPDGVTANSIQGQWLKERLSQSTATFKIVYFHHPPYTSGAKHVNYTWMQWPFKEWGAQVVLAGHAHHYERILGEDGVLYIINGAGGARLSGFKRKPVRGSKKRFHDDVGALRVEIQPDGLLFEFFTRRGQRVDHYFLKSKS